MNSQFFNFSDEIVAELDNLLGKYNLTTDITYAIEDMIKSENEALIAMVPNLVFVLRLQNLLKENKKNVISRDTKNAA